MRRAETHIAPGARIVGEVTGTSEVSIEGEVEGQVRVDAGVVIGEGGTVRGPVIARVIRIAGRVVGDVRASERVEVSLSGSLEGDIAAPRVTIAEGAFFKGRVEMRAETAMESQAAVPQAAAPQPRGTLDPGPPAPRSEAPARSKSEARGEPEKVHDVRRAREAGDSRETRQVAGEPGGH